MKLQTIIALSAAGALALLGYRHRKRMQLSMPEAEESLEETLERRMEQLLDTDRFSLYFQPVVELSTGEIAGGEVLARLNDPELGMIRPDVFLKVIHRMNLQERFDLYMFRKSCAWLSQTGSVRYMSVNFNRKTLSRPGIAGQIAAIAQQNHLEFDRVAIEITELEKEDNIEIYRENIGKLRELGFRIFLDDFGSGVTSIADLNQCAMDIVKIDRSVLLAAESPDGGIILQTLIEMAAKLGVDVVCEGIETQEQEALVRECGCRYGQGLRFYAPVSAEEFQAPDSGEEK